MHLKIDATIYQSAIGSLMYVMIGTYLDLTHSVSILSKFRRANLGEQHQSALKCVHYLCGATNMDII